MASRSLPGTESSLSPGNKTKTETLTFPADDVLKLEPHLPPRDLEDEKLDKVTARGYKKPFITLTFATSLDSSLSLAPGTRTVLSGPESKAMTHYLRSRHAAICVGVGTAIADDPGLNCRLAAPSPSELQHQPRPIIIDPHVKWNFNENAKVLQLARSGLGLAPFILVSSTVTSLFGMRKELTEQRALLEQHGGKYIPIEPKSGGRFAWNTILKAVSDEGLDSVMIEGGGHIINSLLSRPENELIDSVIVTIAPTWLGQGGVVVSPPRERGPDGKPFAPIRLTETSWYPLGEDVVLCGKISHRNPEW
ncbi:Dihydrofolate reductase-like domain containing protein [Naviculisporaceae sp. PSN 640]